MDHSVCPGCRENSNVEIREGEDGIARVRCTTCGETWDPNNDPCENITELQVYDSMISTIDSCMMTVLREGKVPIVSYKFPPLVAEKLMSTIVRRAMRDSFLRGLELGRKNR